MMMMKIVIWVQFLQCLRPPTGWHRLCIARCQRSRYVWTKDKIWNVDGVPLLGYRSPVCGGEWAMCATRGHHHTPVRSPSNMTHRDYIRHRVTHKLWHLAHKYTCTVANPNQAYAFRSYLNVDQQSVHLFVFISTAAFARASSLTKPPLAGNILVSPLRSNSPHFNRTL
jgi:hypothetical protein